jgi:Sec-independent protein translocase protein TatA
VDDFLEAVKAKSHRLSTVDVDELFVYKNKQAFDTKEEPLEEDSSIVGLGGNKDKDALIVVAPSTISSVGVNQGDLLQEIKTILNEQQEQQQKILNERLNEQQEQQQKQQERFHQELLNEQQESFGRFDCALADLKHKTLKSYTFTVIGLKELKRLKDENLVFEMKPNENKEAFWSEEIQNQVNVITNEAAFTAFITPYFRDILQHFNLVFVNSENYKWLPQSSDLPSSTDLKPDGFATHCGMFRAKPISNSHLHQDGFLYGVAEKDLFDCLILFKTKTIITHEAFGQVKHYLQNLQPEETSAAILFDLESFWLISNRFG